MTSDDFEVIFPTDLKAGDIIIVGMNRLKALDYTRDNKGGIIGWGEIGTLDYKRYNENDNKYEKPEEMNLCFGQPIIRVLRNLEKDV